jgi:hypothetical protein
MDTVIIRLNQTKAVMGKKYFAKEFKLEAVRQLVERGFSVSHVAKRFRALGSKSVQMGEGHSAHWGRDI